MARAGATFPKSKVAFGGCCSGWNTRGKGVAMILPILSQNSRVLLIEGGHLLSELQSHIQFVVSYRGPISLCTHDIQQNIHARLLGNILLQMTTPTPPRATSFILRIAFPLSDTFTPQNRSVSFHRDTTYWYVTRNLFLSLNWGNPP